MLFPLIPILSIASIIVTTATGAPSQIRSTDALGGTLIHQFPYPTWVENLVVRHDNTILCSIATAPEIYLIDPSNPNSPTTATLLHSFPAPYVGLTGITETTSDQFYAVVGNISLLEGNFGFGGYTIHSLKLGDYGSGDGAGTVLVEEVVAMPQAGLLNGLITLSVEQELLLAADSRNGCIWLISVLTGTYSIFLQEPEMMPQFPDLSTGLGINGIRFLTKEVEGQRIADLYFTNQFFASVFHLAFDLETYERIGPVTVVEQGMVVDDFCLDAELGVAYTANGPGNALVRLGLQDGVEETVYGGKSETVLLGPTSAEFGRGEVGTGMVYVTTSGSMENTGPEGLLQGGRVLGVNVGF